MHTEFGGEGKTLNSNDISKARLITQICFMISQSFTKSKRIHQTVANRHLPAQS